MPDVPTTAPDDGRPTIVVFDVDGVLADVRHRLRYVERRPKDWDSFFAAMDDDGPLADGIAMAQERAAEGHRVVYLTGRNEDYRSLTRDWLVRHGLPATNVLRLALWIVLFALVDAAGPRRAPARVLTLDAYA